MSNWMKDEVQNPDGTWVQVCRQCGEYTDDVEELTSDYLCEECEMTE
jgi:lipocalin